MTFVIEICYKVAYLKTAELSKAGQMNGFNSISSSLNR